MEESSKKSPRASRDRLGFVMAAGLVALVLAVFLQVVNFDFAGLDDSQYVFQNPRVTAGLSPSGLRWALTTFHEANWHPLTWASLMLDSRIAGLVESFGLEVGSTPASVYHLTNVALHAANVVLLFVLLSLMTGMRWRSAFVSALFAVHPLHVESVAWVAERKDVLSTLFWLLTMLAYCRYVRRPSVNAYLLMTATYALGLMSKPMLVTLPLILILIDFWPLPRLGGTGNREQGTVRPMAELVVEKLPLFVLALCSCAVTIYAQRAGGAMVGTEGFSLVSRLANAFSSYLMYILKAAWPVELGVFYPMRSAVFSPLAAAGAMCFFALAMLAAVWSARRPSLRWIAFGWFWYVITLLPVIGIVQVGVQSMADRYTYVPLIGIFVILAWGVPAVFACVLRGQVLRVGALTAIGVAVVVLLAVQAHRQAGYWKDGPTLLGHTLRVTGSSYYGLIYYGAVLELDGRYDDAAMRYRAAARLRPRGAAAYAGLGTALTRIGKYEEAESCLRKAVALNPDDAKIRNNLGGVLLYQGKTREAAEEFEKALRINPGYLGARANLERARGAETVP
jgi:hypothetical protein